MPDTTWRPKGSPAGLLGLGAAFWSFRDGLSDVVRIIMGLGVLLVVVGLQFFSLGLISELIRSQHEERAGARERTELHVDEVLS